MDINTSGRIVTKFRRSLAYGAGMESVQVLMKGKSQVLEAVVSWRKNEPSLVVWVEVSRMLLAVVGKPEVVLFSTILCISGSDEPWSWKQNKRTEKRENNDE